MIRALARLRGEWALPVGIATTLAFAVFGKDWFADLSSMPWFAFVLAWLFCAIMVCAFAVVRHAETLAERLGEPYGTLVLTVSMSGMEMMMIAAVMFTGHGSASLARDTMLAIVMIVLNGLVGACLLVGGLRYREQTYNLYSANSFLAVILPLSVLGLVLPGFTVSTPGPTLSTLQSIFLIFMSLVLYGVFLAIQTQRHRDYFVAPEEPRPPDGPATTTGADGSAACHVGMLIAYAIPIVLLAKQIALPIDYGISVLRAPTAFGGLLVAVLILAPESMAAVRSALANQLQRSINVALGTALSSISLTIPAVLAIGFITHQSIVLGLDAVDTVLLLLTLVVSMLTFALARTNVLLGAVHLVLFLAYLMLIVEK
ncbi:MAG: calcium:proton antiporter [Pseudomonadota bacterium]|nr:calcium:proton antiporter [Pseudomonadota bacterium]